MINAKQLMQELEHKSIRKLFQDLNKLSFAKAQHEYNKMVMRDEVRI
jgi:hypothetical protein